MAADELRKRQLEILRELDAQIGDVCRSIALTALRNLIATSPVDTGWFRANWIPSIGEVSLEPVGTRAAVDTSAQAAGQADVMRFQFGTDGIITIINAVPYGQRLNEGHSEQAPAKFVEAALEQAVGTVLSFGMDKLDAAISAAAGAGLL